MKKYVLLTGASSNLAKELIKDFNEKNYTVIGISRKEIQDDNNIFISLDLMQKGSLKLLRKKLKEKNIFPNIIVHNLGGKIENDTHPLKAKVLKKSLKLNLGIAVEINSYFIQKAIKKAIKLNIIHISSDSSINGLASPAYVASKSAINAYVKSTARNYIKNAITLCSILPSRFTENMQSTNNNLLDLFPLNRYLKTSEISNFIVHIATLDNICYSGSNIVLDGCKR
ncbi:SDR family NAD(P)-dependent oxidoreductase [Malaciobacter mytili]|uniref:SDR family NAD(P)-dependent oxidoreductase n=1 Tax=Malaciobacter mytili TaxID=603050 RepID=UPI003A8C2727